MSFYLHLYLPLTGKALPGRRSIHDDDDGAGTEPLSLSRRRSTSTTTLHVRRQVSDPVVYMPGDINEMLDVSIAAFSLLHPSTPSFSPPLSLHIIKYLLPIHLCPGIYLFRHRVVLRFLGAYHTATTSDHTRYRAPLYRQPDCCES